MITNCYYYLIMTISAGDNSLFQVLSSSSKILINNYNELRQSAVKELHKYEVDHMNIKLLYKFKKEKKLQNDFITRY